MELYRILLLCLIFLASYIYGQKEYIPDSEGVIRLSNDWQVPKKVDCIRSAWNHIGAGPSNKNSYWGVCFSSNCILESTSYSIKNVKSVFADITYVGRYCTTPTTTTGVTTKAPPPCTEYIAVNANLFDVKSQPGISTEVGIRCPNSDDLKKPLSNPQFFESKQTVEFVNKGNKNNIKYLFDAEEACGSIYNFTVYYYKCPVVTKSLVKFDEYNAPNRLVGEETYKGKCIPNSVNIDGTELLMKCKWNGTVVTSGECVCKEGYEKKETACSLCGTTFFKPDVGNQPCAKCGVNSLTDLDRKICTCKTGYKRAKISLKNFTSECFKIPLAPSNIKLTNVTDNSVTINWSHIDVNSGIYIVDCKSCPGNVFPQNTTDKMITVENLGAFATYQIAVKFSNSITKSIGEQISSDYVEFQTLPGIPGKVQNLQQKRLENGDVELTWDEPFAKGNDAVTYLVTYGGSTKETLERKFVIKSDTQTQTYNVKVAAQVFVNGKLITGESNNFKDPIEIKGGGVPLDIVLGSSIGSVLFVLVLAIVLFLIWKKRNPPYTQVVRLENGQVKLPGRFFPGSKLYVDPTTYNEVDTAVQEFAFELDQKSLKIGQLLGGGEFADVYKGTLFKNGKSKEVAIKTLKPSATKHDRDDFLSEAAIIGQFTDPNVITMEGVVLKERPNVIVLEYMSNGSLDKYLQKHDMQFTSLQLLGMARGVASGMKYLNELGFIHRDLAARNILVDEYRVCKVSDFGMSREIKVDETYDTQGGKIPVRWTAPESIQYKKFTAASDMWSYGILMWEIMSYGERPYWDWGNYEVLERLNQGYRLPPPMNCPKAIHDLMLHCWSKDRTKRPRMVEIRDQLEKWIRSPNLLETTITVVTKKDENLDYTVLQTINKWLDAIGMGKYTENFLEKGYATPRQILSLTLDDLEELGIAPIGHRKKIYKAIQNTKTQVDQRHGIGVRKKTFSLPKKGGGSTN